MLYRGRRDIGLRRTSPVQHVSLRAAGNKAGEPIKALAPKKTLTEAGEGGHHALTRGLSDDGPCWQRWRCEGYRATWCQRGSRSVASAFTKVTCMQRAAGIGGGDEVDSELGEVKEGTDSIAGKDSRYNTSEGGDPRVLDESSQDSTHRRLPRA
jgi:hypothetical protein